MQSVLQCIVALSATCDAQKHARLRAVCEQTTQALQGASAAPSRDAVANALFAPLRIACCTTRGRTAASLAMHGMRGLCALVAAHLIDDTMTYAMVAAPQATATGDGATRKPRSTTTTSISAMSMLFGVTDVTADEALQPVALTRDMPLVDAIVAVVAAFIAAQRSGVGHDGTDAEARKTWRATVRDAVRCLCMLVRSVECGVCDARLRSVFDVLWQSTRLLAASPSDAQLMQQMEHAVHAVLQRASDACAVAHSTAAAAATTAARPHDSDVFATRDMLLRDAAWLVSWLLALALVSHSTHNNSSNEDGAVVVADALALQLVTRALAQAPPALRRATAFARVVRDDVWRSVAAACARVAGTSPPYATAAQLLREYRAVLTWRAPRFVLDVLLPAAPGDDGSSSDGSGSGSSGDAATVMQRLRCASDVLSDASLVAEWYVNYDCVPSAPSVVQLLVRRLCALVRGARVRATVAARHGRGAASEAPPLLLRALRVLVVLLHSIDAIAAATRAVDDAAALQLRERVARKRAYEAMLRTYNDARRYDAALAAARACGVLHGGDDDDAACVARLLHRCGELDPDAVGQHVCANRPQARAVLRALLARHDVAHCSVDEALRRVLYTFRLHGEAEAIDAVVQVFAETYCAQNADAGVSVDDVVALAFAIVMLHTDAHSPQVRVKMTLDEFVRNCRGMASGGGDFAPTLLAATYSRVTSRAFAVRPCAASWSSPLLREDDDDATHAQQQHDDNDDDDMAAARYVTALCVPGVAVAVLQDTWHVLLPTLAMSLEDCSDGDDGVVQVALSAMWHCISIASVARRCHDDDDSDDGSRNACRTQLKAFVSALFTFTRLTGLRAMHDGNVRATELLLRAATQFGNALGDAWHEVVRCVLLLDQLHAVASDVTTMTTTARHASDKDTPSAAARHTPRSVSEGASTTTTPKATAAASSSSSSSTTTAATSVASPLPSQRTASVSATVTMSASALHDVELHNAHLVAQHIGAAAVDKFFSRISAALDDDALTDLLVALCDVVAEEARQQQQQQQHTQSSRCVSLLQRLVEVARCNAARLCGAWASVWPRLRLRICALRGLLRHASVAFVIVNSLRHVTLALLDAHAEQRRAAHGDGKEDGDSDTTRPLRDMLTLYVGVIAVLRRQGNGGDASSSRGGGGDDDSGDDGSSGGGNGSYSVILRNDSRAEDEDDCAASNASVTMRTVDKSGDHDDDSDVALANVRTLFELVAASLQQVVITHGGSVHAASWPVLLHALTLCARSCAATVPTVSDTLARITCVHFHCTHGDDDDDDDAAVATTAQRRHEGVHDDMAWCALMRAWAVLARCAPGDDDDDDVYVDRSADEAGSGGSGGSTANSSMGGGPVVVVLAARHDAVACREAAVCAVWYLRLTLALRCRCAVLYGTHAAAATRSAAVAAYAQSPYAALVEALAWRRSTTTASSSDVATIRALVNEVYDGTHSSNAAAAAVAAHGIATLASLAATARSVCVARHAVEALDDVAALVASSSALMRVFAYCYVDLVDACAARCVQQAPQTLSPLPLQLHCVHGAGHAQRSSHHDSGAVTAWLDDVLDTHTYDTNVMRLLRDAILCATRCAARMTHCHTIDKGNDSNEDEENDCNNNASAHVLCVVDAVLSHTCALAVSAMASTRTTTTAAAAAAQSRVAVTAIHVLERLMRAVDAQLAAYAAATRRGGDEANTTPLSLLWLSLTRRLADAVVLCVTGLQQQQHQHTTCTHARCHVNGKRDDKTCVDEDDTAVAMSCATVIAQLVRALALPLQRTHGTRATTTLSRTRAADCLHDVFTRVMDVLCAVSQQQRQQEGQQKHVSSSLLCECDTCALSRLLVQVQQAVCEAFVASDAHDVSALSVTTTMHTTFWLDVMRSYARVCAREAVAVTCAGQQLLLAQQQTVRALLVRLLSCRDVTPWVPTLCELVACADAATAQPLSRLLSHCWSCTASSSSTAQCM